MPKCATCHSDIGTGTLDESLRVQGEEGTDSLGLPIPRWSDDPLLTAYGLNGVSYGGANKPRKAHILELQERINQLENENALTPTEFSPVDTDKNISRRHIVELREATERLLAMSGLSLTDYFSLDDSGNPVVQNPRLVAYGGNNPQSEWIDVNRGEAYLDKDGNPKTTFTLFDSSVEQSPTLPKGTKVRAVHIEDLRHPLTVGAAVILVSGGSIRQTDLNSTDLYSGVVYEGNKVAHANFKKVAAV